MTENTQLVPTAPAEPLALIEQAIAKGYDPAHLGQLMDLQERWERNRAAERFAAAISAFQAAVPVVLKERVAKINDDWSYNFAGYDDIMRQIAPLLAKYQIVITFSSDQIPQVGIKTTCRVRVGVHFEDHTLTVPIPQMKVNDTQKFGAALSYAKRYALCAALNIVVSNEDDDAAKQLDNVDEEEVAALRDLIETKQVDLPRFLSWAFGKEFVVPKGKEAQLKSLELMTRAEWPKAMDMLRRKK